MPDKIISEIHNQLLHQKKTIAIAESCSGGLLCAKLTQKPGASAYFLLGIVAYSNSSKEKILQVPAKLISKYGAISRQVAISMAEGIRKKSKADLGIGITGLAGPGGSSVNKPVGTVFISLSEKDKNICRRFTFRGSRHGIRNKTIAEALRLLCAHLSP
ncbi:MAG: CinA family protein [Candidatus Omnitrophica bacterium]|nr:CinA family protein [Candidatus Omnitrophota bacterium]